MRKIISLILGATSFFVAADEIQQGVFAKCSEGYKIEVGSYNFLNGSVSPATNVRFPYLSKTDQSFIYKDSKEHKINCNVAGKTISVKFNLEDPRPRGACGAVPGGKLALEIDGVSIINNATLNNECYQSIEKISISSFNNKTENIKYSFCGTGNSSNFKFDGCIEIRNESFSKLNLPLTNFPISKLLRQTNAF